MFGKGLYGSKEFVKGTRFLLGFTSITFFVTFSMFGKGLRVTGSVVPLTLFWSHIAVPVSMTEGSACCEK